MAVSLLSRQPRGPCPPPAPPSLPALFVRPQRRRRRRRPPRVPWVGDRNQVKVAPSRSATVNRMSGCRDARAVPLGSPPRGSRERSAGEEAQRAQEPGGGGRGLHVPSVAAAGERGDSGALRFRHTARGEPETIKVLRAPGQRQGDTEPGNAATMGAEPRAGSACLSPAPRGSARLGSARQLPAPLVLAPPRLAHVRPAPPRPWSGASRPRRALTRLGGPKELAVADARGQQAGRGNRGGGGRGAAARPAAGVERMVDSARGAGSGG